MSGSSPGPLEHLVTEGHWHPRYAKGLVVDINYLLKREQVSLLRAKSARSIEARSAHAGLARGYAAKLRESTYPHASGQMPKPRV